jgi:hypothetical protein
MAGGRAWNWATRARDERGSIPGNAAISTAAVTGMLGEHWLNTLLLVSMMVTVLSALFFAWIGHTPARQQQRQLPQRDRELQHIG